MLDWTGNEHLSIEQKQKPTTSSVCLQAWVEWVLLSQMPEKLRHMHARMYVRIMYVEDGMLY